MLIYFALALTACSVLPNYRQHEHVFNPQAAYAEVTFPVLDRREEANKKFRKLDQSPAFFEYGDEQFLPSRVRVVASHFAAAFPRASAKTPLVIERFDVQDSMPRPTGDGPLKEDSVPFPALARLYWGIPSAERNRIICQLKGSFGNAPFEVTHHANYGNPAASKEHAQAVNSAMLSAITKAIEQVRKHNSSSSR